MIIQSDITRLNFKLYSWERNEDSQWSNGETKVFSSYEEVHPEGLKHPIPRFLIRVTRDNKNWKCACSVDEFKSPGESAPPVYVTIHKGDYFSPFVFKDKLVELGVIK